jgi:hypothetical protein
MCANVVIIREDFMQTYPCIYRESRTFTGDFEGIAKFFGLLGEDGKWHGLKGNKPPKTTRGLVSLLNRLGQTHGGNIYIYEIVA